MDYEVWMELAKRAIEANIQVGQKFEVKNLFTGYDWEQLSRGERSSFGKYFSGAVKDGRLPMVERCEENRNRHNQYVKRLNV